MTTPKIFLIDDEGLVRASMRQGLELEGMAVEDFSNAMDMLNVLPKDHDGMIVTDVKMPGISGVELLSRVKQIDPDLPVILITGHGDIDMAVKAMQLGAYDFIEKPFEPERLIEAVKRGIEKRRLILENRSLRHQIDAYDKLAGRLIGVSDPIKRLRDQIASIAPTNANVLLLGETGTGKEVAAKCLHDLSQSSNGPFVAINGAAIPETTAESELFGHERGSFTGAYQNHVGSMVRAESGTLFLDEIVSMPIGLQAKLLRALQESEVLPLGASKTVKTNFRLISAANEEPKIAIEQSRLRADLYYRINTVELRLPPLRERREDIPVLFRCFADIASDTYDRPTQFLTSTELAGLMAHNWPGNVRELRNVAERMVLNDLPENDRLTAAMTTIDQSNQTLSESASLEEQLHHFERQIIQNSIRRHGGKISLVIEELDVPRRTLNSKMARLGIMRQDDSPS
ncbi:MAG: sigma-54-dependent transcriptional regulator [Methyloligellaceae bacterium]